MFPFEDVDDDLAWDEYGAALRPGEFENAEEFDPGAFPHFQTVPNELGYSQERPRAPGVLLARAVVPLTAPADCALWVSVKSRSDGAALGLLRHGKLPAMCHHPVTQSKGIQNIGFQSFSGLGLKICAGGPPGERSEEEDDNDGAGGAPTKVVVTEVALAVRARVAALDYEGLADARSVRTLLQLVAPRHLVLAQGPAGVRACLIRLLVVVHAGTAMLVVWELPVLSVHNPVLRTAIHLSRCTM